jgi:hypothetical protein
MLKAVESSPPTNRSVNSYQLKSQFLQGSPEFSQATPAGN